MTLTEDRIGQLWDEAVAGGWTLDHRHVVDFVRRVERELGARWVSVEGRPLPPFDVPTLLWGDKLVSGEDHPLSGRLCGCHGDWVLEYWEWQDIESKNVDASEYTERMLGRVTHWLDWWPGPEGP